MLRWLFVLLAGLLLAPLSAFAVTTNTVTLSTTQWTDLGTGPIQLSAYRGPIFYQIADSQPVLVSVGFRMDIGQAPQSISTASHIWALPADSNPNSQALVAPISASGGGGGSLTWPGTAPVTTYGTAPSGTVPAVNAAVTNFPSSFTANAGTNLNTSALALETGGNLAGINGKLTTTANGLKVDGSGVTQPISGSVTANAGTNLNTSALALETGGNLASVATNTARTNAGVGAATALPVQGVSGGVAVPVSGTFWQSTQPVSAASLPLPTGASTSANQPTNATIGSTTSGQTGTLGMGATTTAAPSYTTAQTNPLSLDTSGNLRATLPSAGSMIVGPTTTTGQGLVISGYYNSTAPTATAGSPVALQTDISGRLLTYTGSGAGIVTAAGGAITSSSAWTAGGQYKATAPSLTDTQGSALQVDSAGILRVVASRGGYAGGQTMVNATSGVVSNATATATMSAQASAKNYLTSFEVTGLGATAAGSVTATVAINASTVASYVIAIPAGVTTGITPLVVTFSPPLVTSAVNQTIAVSVPAAGSGNTAMVVNAHGWFGP